MMSRAKTCLVIPLLLLAGTARGEITAFSDPTVIEESLSCVGSKVAIDSPTFVTDCTNNRVGIGNATPATALDVTGTVTATLFSGSGASLTSLPGAQVGSGVPAANIAAGAMVEGARLFAAADCATRAAPAAGSFCWHTSTFKLYGSTGATTGPDYVLIGPP